MEIIIFKSPDKTFPPKSKTKELSKNLFGQVFVPVVDDETNVETGDGFCIDRRWLLSVTFLRQIRDGEHEAIYTIQQAMINYLNPNVSDFELQVCLSKAKELQEHQEQQQQQEHIQIDEYFDDDLRLVLSGNFVAVMSNENYGIEAPSNSTLMKNCKGWISARPFIIKKRKITTVPEKVARLETLDWLRNWKIVTRQRRSGQHDYFYLHRRVNVMCRSIIEVHRFHSTGILPTRPIPRRLLRPLRRPFVRRPFIQRPVVQRPIIQDDPTRVNQIANPAVVNPVPPNPNPDLELQPVQVNQNANHQAVPNPMPPNPQNTNEAVVNTVPPQPQSESVKKKEIISMKRAFDECSSSSTSSQQPMTETLKEASKSVQASPTTDDVVQPPTSVQDFLRDFYKNLNNNNPSSSASTTSFQNKKYVEDFLTDSNNNLLNNNNNNNTPMPNSPKGEGCKKRKVAEKSAEEKPGDHEDDECNV